MSNEIGRRTFLRGSAAAAAAGMAGVLGSGRIARASTGADRLQPAYDPTLPDGWTYPVVAELLPFGHGVMSGDPLPDRIVLWTRITIPDPRGWDATTVADPQGITEVEVGWRIARDPRLTQVVRAGRVTTTAERDWTVKVDADRLPAATTLYYAFDALGHRSPVGRTRTAPAPDSTVSELTIAHLSCSSWWQDLFNGYARIAERDDLDLITHAGDYVYDNSGGHPASRLWAGQADWRDDLDNGQWRTIGECRRRWALYYADPNLLRAHLAAPFAIMTDNHEDADGEDLTSDETRRVIHEWTATRPVRPDGSGEFLPSPGPDAQVHIPTEPEELRYFYRSLSFGSLAEVVLLDVRRFARSDGDESQVLGDEQFAWLERTLLASAGRTFRCIVNQVNLGQLRAVNLPFAEAFREQLDLDDSGAELYTVAWGGSPADRLRLLGFLRARSLIDNVVLSGDSHGWFGYDLVEDPQPPAYEPLTGGGTLGPVGVELVPCTMGRPGAQDVIAEELYFASVQGSRGAAFTDAERFDAEFRPAALPATLGLEAAAQAANPNLRFFNWRSDFGYAMVHLRPDRVVLEAWTVPQRVLSDQVRLLAQLESLVGAPHLRPVQEPAALQGSRRDAPAPPPQTVPPAGVPGPGSFPPGAAAPGAGTLRV